MTTIVKATGPGEVIHLIPRMMRYVPERSLIVLPMVDGRTSGALRLDVPPAASVRECGEQVAILLERLPGISGFVTALYWPSFDDDLMDRHEAIVGAMIAMLPGVKNSGSFFVTEQEWRSIDGEHGLLDLTAFAGIPRGSFQDVTPESDERRAAFAQQLETLDRDALAPIELGEGLGSGELPTDRLAEVVAAMEVAKVRDVVLAALCFGPDRGAIALAAQLDYEQGAQYPPELAAFAMGEGPRPQPDRLDHAMALLRQAAALTDQPGVFATLAWLCWATGSSSAAQAWAARSLELDENHGLARIVAAYVAVGFLPNWAFTAQERD